MLRRVANCANDDEEVKLREELISAMNHDLRSPLGAIAIFCEILTMHELDEGQRQNLSLIQEANTKAQRILDDASELLSIYRGNLVMNPGEVSPRQLVGSCLEQLDETLRHKSLTIQQELDGLETCLLVDREKMEQVLLRLLDEAVAITPREGTIIIRSGSEAGGEVTIVVEGGEVAFGAQVPKRPTPAHVKGRLGVRKPGESRYSLLACKRIMESFGGSLSWDVTDRFSAVLRFEYPAR